MYCHPEGGLARLREEIVAERQNRECVLATTQVFTAVAASDLFCRVIDANAFCGWEGCREGAPRAA